MKKLLPIAAILTLGASFYWWGHSDGRSGVSVPALVGTAHAQEGGGAAKPQSPVEPVLPRDVYPNVS